MSLAKHSRKRQLTKLRQVSLAKHSRKRQLTRLRQELLAKHNRKRQLTRLRQELLAKHSRKRQLTRLRQELLAKQMQMHTLRGWPPRKRRRRAGRIMPCQKPIAASVKLKPNKNSVLGKSRRKRRRKEKPRKLSMHCEWSTRRMQRAQQPWQQCGDAGAPSLKCMIHFSRKVRCAVLSCWKVRCAILGHARCFWPCSQLLGHARTF